MWQSCSIFFLARGYIIYAPGLVPARAEDVGAVEHSGGGLALPLAAILGRRLALLAGALLGAAEVLSFA